MFWGVSGCFGVYRGVSGCMGVFLFFYEEREKSVNNQPHKKKASYAWMHSSRTTFVHRRQLGTHSQHVVNRGNRLSAQLSWCRAERLPLHMVIHLLGVRCRITPLLSRVWIVRCASGVGSRWVGPLVRPMLVSCELG